jgi:hypothetical protein
MNPFKAANHLMQKIQGTAADPATPEPGHREKYDYAVIRQALLEILSDGDLNTLCSTHYGIVHNRFSTGMTKDQKLELLLDQCRETQGMEQLFQHVKNKRPRFADFEPYCYLEQVSADAPGKAELAPAAEALAMESVGVNFQHKAEYHNRNILQVISEAFTLDELLDFIHNSADFQGFEPQAARLPEHRAVCRELSLYAQRRLTIDRLLEQIKAHKPDAYQAFRPYVKPAAFDVDAKFVVKANNEWLTALQTPASTAALGRRIVEMLEQALVRTLGTAPSPADDGNMACESAMTAAFWVPTYRMDNVRRLVGQAFTTAELARLIREEAAFKNLAGKLPPQPTHNQMLLAQLEYSYNLKRIKALLNLAQVQQPELFQRLQPYYGSAQFVSRATLTVNGDDIRLVDLHKKEFTRALRQRFSETLDGPALQAVQEIVS